MSSLRLFAALVIVVCALTPSTAAEIQLRKSEIITCSQCWGVWGDFNGDGLDDLIVRKNLYWNLGGVLAAAPVELRDLKALEEVIEVADFNGDGRADLLTYEGNDRPDKPPRMLIGDGAGRFRARPMPPGGGAIVHAGDFTGDGVVDLLRWDFPDRELSILRGNGDATFTLHQVLPWHFEQAYYFTPADVNGDGRPDIVSPYEDYLHILLAQPDGQFGEVVTRFTRMRLTWATKVADVNGDGKADLISNEGHDGTPGITVLFGDGTGRFPGVARYQVPPPTPDAMIYRGSVATPVRELFPKGGATEIQVADFIEGGANEIAFGQQGEGFVAVLGVVDGQLVELARQDVDGEDPHVQIVRFTMNKPQLVALAQWYDGNAPRGSRLRYSKWFFEPEGLAPSTVTSRRRTRAIGRHGFEGGRYDVSIQGDCALPSLREWSLDREGMFVHVAPSSAIERGEAVFLDGEVYMRLHVRDGAMTRVLDGTLKVTELGLSGKLFEWGDSGCSGRWQVHRVEASLSH
jgi:hypothetical protein